VAEGVGGAVHHGVRQAVEDCDELTRSTRKSVSRNLSRSARVVGSRGLPSSNTLMPWTYIYTEECEEQTEVGLTDIQKWKL